MHVRESRNSKFSLQPTDLFFAESSSLDGEISQSLTFMSVNEQKKTWKCRKMHLRKCLEIQNFPGGMSPDPPRMEGPLGL